MKDTRQMIIMACVAVAIVGLAVGLASLFHGQPAPVPVYTGWSWGEQGYYGVGLANAVVLGPIMNPPGYTFVDVRGNISTVSWHRYQGGVENSTGSCSVPTPAPGVCNVYVGIWTTTAWAAYASGESATPLWCYSTGGSGCTNATAFSFTSSNLASSGSAGWVVVIWNVVPWGLYGFINVTEYFGPAMSHP
jgi:hypothetical protein